VTVILQRLGHGRLYACRRCGELARCAQCHQAEVEVGEFVACSERHELRANFCRSCGATNLRKVRVGVSTLARDVAAQLSQPVDEVTAASRTSITARVVVGTEAVFNRVRRTTLVVFVDFDQYLLAPRDSARRAALTSVAKAGRLVGSRREGRGVVVLQTRRHDDVIDAITNGDVRDIVAEDVETARALSLPPFAALAHVSGEAAEEFMAGVNADEVRVRQLEGTYVVSASNVEVLTRVLRETPRPAGRLRLEVF
jgi:primosomal protein N'